MAQTIHNDDSVEFPSSEALEESIRNQTMFVSIDDAMSYYKQQLGGNHGGKKKARRKIKKREFLKRKRKLIKRRGKEELFCDQCGSNDGTYDDNINEYVDVDFCWHCENRYCSNCFEHHRLDCHPTKHIQGYLAELARYDHDAYFIKNCKPYKLIK